jgi:hypothetical protein
LIPAEFTEEKLFTFAGFEKMNQELIGETPYSNPRHCARKFKTSDSAKGSKRPRCCCFLVVITYLLKQFKGTIQQRDWF